MGKLAREKGCMIARKFATHINVPGVPMNEQKITGEISIDQWNEVIQELQQQDDLISQSAKVEIATAHGDGPGEKVDQGPPDDGTEKDTAEGKEEVKEESPATAEKDEKTKEEEDDEGETQLE